MKTSDNSLLQQAQAILLMGPPGSGKTTFALKWPGLYVVDADQNLAGPLRYLNSKGKFTPFKYDIVALDDANQPVEAHLQWPRLKSCVEAAIKDPTVLTLFIDSLTHVDRIVYAYACKTQNVKELEFQQWNMFKNELYRFIMNIRSKGKTLIMSCHENIEYDKKGQVEKYVPTLSTNLKNYFGYIFTDVWRCTLKPVGGGKIEGVVSTHPTALSDLKNSLLFDKGEIAADYDIVRTAIDKIKLPTLSASHAG